MTNIRQFKNKKPQIGKNVFIDPMACIIGDVKLGDDSSIWPMVVIRGDLEPISIGTATNIQDGSVLHTTRKSKENPNGFPLKVGNHVTIGHSVTLHGCEIHNLVLIGMRSVILDGVVIPSNVMIGAGSLVPVNKTLESNYLYVGSPVKKIRLLTKQELNFLKESSNNYIKTKNEHINMFI